MKLAAALALACLLLAGGAYAHEGFGHGDGLTSSPARGLVLRDLVRARPDGPCKLGFELRLPGNRIGCTHGPDPAPPGRDVRTPRTLGDIAASTSGDPSAEPGPGGDVVCVGDGVDGNRVQAVYAYPADGAHNYAEVAPYIQKWAAQADGVMNASAAETGGIRHVRYVTSPGCQVDVAEVALSPDGVASLAGTAADLEAQGFDRPDRKYLVWVDAYVYCGVATVEPDDRAGAENENNGNGQPGMVARVDRGCWGNPASSTEAHELTHILGGVQPSSPHGTWNYHCSDEHELMCYDDDGTADGYVRSHGQLVPLLAVCPTSHERLLDCNHDDYFSTSPAPQGWLAQHWNVADSSFLTSEGPPVVADTTAPRPTAPRPIVEGRLGRTVPVRLKWSSPDADVAGYWLWRSVDGRPWRYVPRPNIWEASALVAARAGHTYRYLVHAFDAAGNASAAVFGRPFTPSVIQERNRAVQYQGAWRRLYARRASAHHVASPRPGPAASKVVFRGRAVAWVSRRSPLAGQARVYVDGRYAGTVDLVSSAVAVRQTVFAQRFNAPGPHRLRIVPIQGSGRVAVDAFVVLR
jgi:hypothetical protein